MTPAGPGVICRDSSPLTYLDHWAMRLFSTDDALAERLVAAIHASGGSLALSWLNVGEWATVTDRAQRLRIEELLNRLLPNLYCIEVEPFAVITREERGQFRAQADEALARLFVNDRERTVHPFTATGLFEPVNHPRLIAAKDRLAQTTLGQLENLRIEYMQNANFRREVKKGGTPGATDTLAVLRALVATYLPDPKRTLDTPQRDRFPARDGAGVLLRRDPPRRRGRRCGQPCTAQAVGRREDRSCVLRARRRRRAVPRASRSSGTSTDPVKRTTRAPLRCARPGN